MSRAIRLWFVTYVIIAGFLFYHSPAPLETIMLGGIVSLAFIIYKERRR